MKINDVYKCKICGNIVSVLHASNGALSCCGQNMILLDAKTAEGAGEKHLPFVEKKENGYLIKIGSVEHPMTEEHFIEWIEVITENNVYRKILRPNEKPEYLINIKETKFIIKAYCNLHGLWELQYSI